KEKRASSEHKHTHTGPCKSSTEGASRRYNSEIQNILNRYILKSENRIVLDGIHDVDGKYAGIPENDPASWSAYGDAIMAYPPDLDRKDVCEVIYYALGKYRVALLFGSEPAYYEKFLDTALDFLGKSFECRGDTARMARVVDECNALFDERKSVFMHHDAVTRKLYRMNGMLAYNNVLSSPELKNKYGKRASCYEEYAGDALHEKHTRDGQGGRHSPGGAGESGVRESAPRIDDAAVLAGMKAVDEKYAGIKAGERNAYVAYGDELMQYAARVGGKAACGVMYCALEKYRVALRSGSEPVYYEKFLDAALDFIGESFEYGGDTARVAGVVDECNALFDEKKPSFLNNQAVLKKLYDMNSGLSYVDESDASLQKYRKRAAYYEELGGGW
ncbi:hypothetical protein, partial [Mailhella massiliensis]